MTSISSTTHRLIDLLTRRPWAGTLIGDRVRSLVSGDGSITLRGHSALLCQARLGRRFAECGQHVAVADPSDEVARVCCDRDGVVATVESA